MSTIPNAPSRRKLLEGAMSVAAAVPVAALPSPAPADPLAALARAQRATLDALDHALAQTQADHPDAALLALGRDLDAKIATWLDAEPEYATASEARSKVMREHGPKLLEASAAGGRDAWWAEWACLTGHHEPAIARGNALMEVADAIGARIMDLKPTTLAGLAVQARFVAFTIDLTPDPVEADRDWDKLVVLRLAANLAALAG